MEYNKIGEISVESGRILITDPCYKSSGNAITVKVKGLESLNIELIKENNTVLAVQTSSGWGDGTYSVYCCMQGNVLAGLFIDLRAFGGEGRILPKKDLDGKHIIIEEIDRG